MSVGRPITDDDLNAYVDGALAGARRDEVEAYLATNPEAASRIAGYRNQRTHLRAMLAPIADEPMPADLRLRHLIAARDARRATRWRAAAAVLLLCVGGGVGFFARGLSGQPRNSLTALAEEAIVSYEVFAPDKARPVEIRAAEQDQLVRWVSNRLHQPMKVPDLAASGYRFLGGRLVPTANGPAGFYLYDDDRGTRVAILVRPMANESLTTMTTHDEGPIAGFAWATRGLGYSLVATTTSQALHPLAEEIRRQMNGPVKM